jgi:hypothetical protein
MGWWAQLVSGPKGLTLPDGGEYLACYAYELPPDQLCANV